jgi:hypothetical protein
MSSLPESEAEHFWHRKTPEGLLWPQRGHDVALAGGICGRERFFKY